MHCQWKMEDLAAYEFTVLHISQLDSLLSKGHLVMFHGVFSLQGQVAYV